MPRDQHHEDPPDAGMTSFHMRRAKTGDASSLDWVVRRFTPLLLEQARYRIGPALAAHCDPEDLVNDVWAIALPRLPDLPEYSGRATPVIVKFLSTALLYRTNGLLRKHLSRTAGQVSLSRDDERSDPIANLPANRSGVVTSAVRRETNGIVAQALAALDPTEREIIILRAIEQNSNKTVAVLLRIEPNAASMRFQRALAKLRAELPDSVFDDFADESG